MANQGAATSTKLFAVGSEYADALHFAVLTPNLTLRGLEWVEEDWRKVRVDSRWPARMVSMGRDMYLCGESFIDRIRWDEEERQVYQTAVIDDTKEQLLGSGTPIPIYSDQGQLLFYYGGDVYSCDTSKEPCSTKIIHSDICDRFEAGVCVLDKCVYFVGGTKRKVRMCGGIEHKSYVETGETKVVDVDSGQWSTLAPVPQPGKYQALAYNGKIFAIERICSNMYIYDRTANTWASTMDGIPEWYRHRGTYHAVAHNGQIFAMECEWGDLYIYDIGENSWTPKITKPGELIPASTKPGESIPTMVVSGSSIVCLFQTDWQVTFNKDEVFEEQDYYFPTMLFSFEDGKWQHLDTCHDSNNKSILYYWLDDCGISLLNTK